MLNSLNFAVVINPPSVTDCFFNKSQACPKPGFAVEMALVLCASLNYACTFTWAGTDAYGYLENGTWHGVIGLIKNESFDLSLPRFAPTSDRFKAVDFSNAFFYDHMLLVTRLPHLRDTSTGKRLDLFSAFKWHVWLCIAGVLILAAHLLDDTLIMRRKKSLIESLFQKFASKVFFHCRRFCIALISLTALILLRSYTSYLFSQRVPSYGRPPFDDLKSFVECMEKRECTLVTTSPTMGYLKETLAGDDDVLMRRLKNVLVNRPVRGVFPPEDMLNAILNEKSKFLTGFIWSTDFYYAAGENECKFFKSPTVFRPGARTIPLIKKSPLVRDINLVADTLWESGISNKILASYYHERTCPLVRPPLQPASLEFLLSIFIFYVVGATVSISVAIFEIACPRFGW